MFDFEFFAPEPGRFVPMYLSQTQRAIGQSDASNTFAFTPASTAVNPTQPSDLADARSCREGFDLRNFADDFK